MIKINWNAKTFRRTLAGIILFTAFVVIIPSLFVEQSFNAIINARIISIHSPVEGTVNLFKKEVGDSVKSKELIAVINNVRINSSFKKELEVERNSLEERIKGFNQHIERLNDLKRNLTDRLNNKKSFESARVNKQIQEQEHELSAQKNSLNELKVLFDAQEKLIKSGSVSRIEYENTKYRILSAQDRLRALESRIDILKTEKQALEKNVFLGEGRNDVPYTQQKIDEINVMISDINSRKLEQVRRVKEIDNQIGTENARLLMNRVVDLVSPVDGIIWKKMFLDNSEVVIGSEVAQVADCSRLFLEVEVNENSLSKIELGSPVQYRLRNTKEWLVGKISGKSGSGRTLVDRSLAAELFLERTQAKITVQINSKDLDSDPRNYCHIGRKVEVTLPRAWTTGIWFSRFDGLSKWN